MASRTRTARDLGLGLVAGSAAGFTLGLMLAPHDGRQLRRRLAYLLDRWADSLGAVVARLDAGVAGPSVARDQGDRLIADAHEQARELLSEADAVLDAARRRASERP